MSARSALLVVFCFAFVIFLGLDRKQSFAQTGTFDDLIINGVGNVVDFRPDLVNNSFSIFANQFTFDIDGDAFGALRVSNETPTNTVVLTADGVGVGTAFPVSALDVFAGSGSSFQEARVTIENSFSSDVQPRTLLQMTNSGPVRFHMTNSDSDKTWSFVADSNDQFQIRQNGVGTSSFSTGTTADSGSISTAKARWYCSQTAT